ncbi:hypothetical protein ACWPO1_00235 [Acinetobacter nosocomialis]
MTKYQKYAEYKDSGVEALGLIPKGWSILRGKFLFKEINERSESGEETLLSVSEYYGVKPREEKIADGDFLTRAESLEGYKKCYPNDLVMNIMLAWKRGLGVSKYEGIVSPAYSVFRFSEQVNSDYIHYLLRTEEYTKYFKTRSTGIIDSRLRLYPESFGDIFILFPTLEIQTQIANFLDYETTKIDTLIAKQEKLIELLKEKRQAVISHAVTKGLNPNVPMKDSGVEWLGEVPEHWIVKRLKHISPKIGVGLVINPSTYTREEGVYFIFGGDVKEYEFDLSKTRRISKHDSDNLLPSRLNHRDLVSIRVGYPGVTAVVTKELEGANCASIIVIRRGKYNSDWLCAAMNIWVGRQQVELASYGAAQKQFNVADAIEFKFPVPPANEQDEIAIFVEETRKKFDNLSNKALQQIELLKERRTALISAAVTGKIDVRNWQHPNQKNNTPTELSA